VFFTNIIEKRLGHPLVITAMPSLTVTLLHCESNAVVEYARSCHWGLEYMPGVVGDWNILPFSGDVPLVPPETDAIFTGKYPAVTHSSLSQMLLQNTRAVRQKVSSGIGIFCHYSGRVI